MQPHMQRLENVIHIYIKIWMQENEGENGHLEINIHNIKFYWAQQGTEIGNWKQYKQIK